MRVPREQQRHSAIFMLILYPAILLNLCISSSGFYVESLEQRPLSLNSVGSDPLPCPHNWTFAQVGPVWTLGSCWSRTEVQCTACAGAHGSAQSKSPLSLSQSPPQPPPSCLIVESLHRASQPSWTLSMYWEVSCNGSAIIRDLGCC